MWYVPIRTAVPCESPLYTECAGLIDSKVQKNVAFCIPVPPRHVCFSTQDGQCVWYAARILTTARALNHVWHTPAPVSAGNNLPDDMKIPGPLRADCTEKYEPAVEATECMCNWQNSRIMQKCVLCCFECVGSIGYTYRCSSRSLTERQAGWYFTTPWCQASWLTRKSYHSRRWHGRSPTWVTLCRILYWKPFVRTVRLCTLLFFSYPASNAEEPDSLPTGCILLTHSVCCVFTCMLLLHC